MNAQKYQIQSLEQADKKMLRLGMLGYIVVPVIFAMFIFFGFSWVQDQWLFSNGVGVQEYAVLGFLSIICIFCSVMLWKKVGDFQAAVKHVYTGVVQDKRKSISRSSHGGGVKGSGRSTSTTVTYHIKLQDKEFTVDYSKYTRCKVGDEIQLAIAPKSKVILHLNLIDKGPEEQPESRFSTSYTADAQPKNESLNSDDIQILRKAWWARLRRAIFIAGIPLFILISLMVSGWYGLALLFFPLWIVVLWQGIALLRYYIRYRNCLQENSKELIPATVMDKYSSSQNGGGSSYYLNTNNGKAVVSKSDYDQVTGGDQVVIEKAKNMNTVLRITRS